MADLIERQGTLQRSIERTIDNFKKIGKANVTPAKVRHRIQLLKDTWRQYQDGHALLLKSVPAASRVNMEYFRDNQFEAVEDIYQATGDYLAECLENLEPVVSQNQSLDTSFLRADASASSLSHLPPIKLPPFEGSFSEWETFRDRFNALIIQNRALSDFARMHYLASSLKGRALDSISTLSITADNFPTAWDMLTKRFENKRRLLSSHFSTLLGLSVVTKESASTLQALFDQITNTVSAMKNLGRSPSDLWNDFLVHLSIQKVDSASRKAWTLKTSDSDSPPTFEELSNFMSHRIRALEEYSSNSAAKNSKPSGSSRVIVATASVSALPVVQGPSFYQCMRQVHGLESDSEA